MLFNPYKQHDDEIDESELVKILNEEYEVEVLDEQETKSLDIRNSSPSPKVETRHDRYVDNGVISPYGARKKKFR